VLRAVLPPLVTAYAIFVAMVLLARRRPVERPHGGAGGPVPARGVLETVAGGYVAFLAVVLVFHVWLAGEPDALASAAWGGVFLASLAIAAWAGWSVFEARRRARRR
jgi:hypothetical protein